MVREVPQCKPVGNFTHILAPRVVFSAMSSSDTITIIDLTGLAPAPPRAIEVIDLTADSPPASPPRRFQLVPVPPAPRRSARPQVPRDFYAPLMSSDTDNIDLRKTPLRLEWLP